MQKSAFGKNSIKAVGKKIGFTLVEALVSVSIFLFFSLAFFQIYRYTMQSFQASSWKHDKASQCEIFWLLLRKNLEEATNKHEINNLTATMVTKPRPLQYRTVPTNAPEAEKRGKILAWTRNSTDKNGNFNYQLFCILSLEGRKLRFEVQQIPGTIAPPAGELVNKVVIEHVEGISVKTTGIRSSEVKGEYLDEGPNTDPIVASLVEISIFLTPPPNLNIKGLTISQNNKFKIPVDSEEKALSDPDFSYPPMD